MRKKFLFIFLFCSSLILSGCAEPPNPKLNLNYQLEKPTEKVYQVKSGQKVHVTVKDQRDAPDPGIVFYPNPNGYFEYMGRYYLAEKPVADITKEAINSGLQQMNFQITDDINAKYHFYCDIKGVYPKPKSKFSSVSLVVKIHTTCYLIDEENRKIIWKEDVEGEGLDEDVKQPFFPIGELDENEGGKAFNLALTNLVRNIQNSNLFKEKIANIN